jgi:CheY-like chemotaxis protein
MSDPNSPGGAEDKSKARINFAAAKVLVIQPPRSQVLAKILEGFGIKNLVSCHSSKEAWDAIKANTFDLAICDGNLENEGEAFEFIGSVRRTAPEPNRFCPFVLMLGHTPADHIARARDCGANIVVAKPLRADILLDRIVWIATAKRNFLETDHYVGPDRRFQNLGPPADSSGRRKTDSDSLDVGEAVTRNLDQDELDEMVKPTKFKF